ncbi:MAG: hypothetical protein LBR88_04430 [Zoogloeaceae bacterium]|jgi:hypothetical protein|nr:hypothetical protein [Zoogloeaceae bacterium]
MDLNLANGLFKGFNDKNGIMLCGYEWGYSKKDQENDEKSNAPALDLSKNDAVFSNKATFYGERANGWRYDQRIIKWFALWGHPLGKEKDDFEKTIVQTNWCNTQGHRVEENYWEKLLAPQQVDNFLEHVRVLQPRLILFFGSQIIHILQDTRVLGRFQDIVGKIVPIDGKPFVLRKKEDFQGRKFDIGFQNFEHCKVVGLPHPNGTRGLQDDYIALFKDEIGSLIQEVKVLKHI